MLSKSSTSYSVIFPSAGKASIKSCTSYSVIPSDFKAVNKSWDSDSVKLAASKASSKSLTSYSVIPLVESVTCSAVCAAPSSVNV